MFNTILVLVIIYLLVSGGRNGWYNKVRGDGYGRRNNKLSRGRYSEYGGYGGKESSRYDNYSKYENEYGSQNNNDRYNNQNDPWDSGRGRGSNDRNNSRNSFDDW